MIAQLLPGRLLAPSTLLNPRWLQRSMAIAHSARRSRIPSTYFSANRASFAVHASQDAPTGYRNPPKEILEIVETPPEPLYSFSPDRKRVLQLSRPPSNPPIAEFARPELKLAGMRIDPEGFCRSRMTYYTGMALADFTNSLTLPLAAGLDVPISGIPEGYGINDISWSPNSKYIAFTIRPTGSDPTAPRPPAELWLAETSSGKAKCLVSRGLNSIFDEYTWVDDDNIVVAAIPENLPPAPTKPAMPLGPKVEDNSDGKKSQNRTYQDLLSDATDEALFDHYGNSELLSVHVPTSTVVPLSNEARVYTAIAPSPDGRYLLVAWLEKPWSRVVPCGRFAKRVQLWDTKGSLIREIAALPLALDIPLAFDSCRMGPRSIGWRDDKPAELTWVECQDGGDPAVEVSPRDIVYALEADTAGESSSSPRQIAATDMRYGGVTWGTGDMALLYESEWKTRRTRTWIIAPDGSAEPELLFDRQYEDVYSDPGSPVMRRTPLSTYVLAEVDRPRQLLMQGSGAGPEGSRPFLDLFDLSTKEKTRIWQSSPPYYELVSSILDDAPSGPIPLEGLRMLARRESVEEPPQFSIVSFAAGGKIADQRQISFFPHPYPLLQGLQKQVVQYTRDDGVALNATLYLPPGYDKEKDGPLPCLIWAYPREFKNKEAAGQLRRSPHTFDSIGSSSPLLFLTQGFAVLDGPSFPIVAEGGEEPNDTYVAQLTASAQAAVEELGRQGCVDTKRVAIAGHSYGAFMAAGLLAHAPKLFACGIARSGAYNRTMTPFGFQSEERTLWQASETYMKMSPFMNANKVERPLLLIHGEADNNPGTFTLQSERMYAALKGHGVVTRLVVLPYESHSYVAKESILHCLAETHEWLDKYC